MTLKQALKKLLRRRIFSRIDRKRCWNSSPHFGLPFQTVTINKNFQLRSLQVHKLQILNYGEILTVNFYIKWEYLITYGQIAQRCKEMFWNRSWSSLEEGDDGCIGPSGKLLCLWQIEENYEAHVWHHSIHTPWTGPCSRLFFKWLTKNLFFTWKTNSTLYLVIFIE